MIENLNSNKNNIIAIQINGEIVKEEVEKLHERIHEITEKDNKVDFYVELNEFHGYSLDALWEGLKMDAAHINDYRNIAIVGEKRWHEWAAKATELFAGSEVKYFDLNDKEAAKNWIGL